MLSARLPAFRLGGGLDRTYKNGLQCEGASRQAVVLSQIMYSNHLRVLNIPVEGKCSYPSPGLSRALGGFYRVDLRSCTYVAARFRARYCHCPICRGRFYQPHRPILMFSTPTSHDSRCSQPQSYRCNHRSNPLLFLAHLFFRHQPFDDRLVYQAS